MKRKIVTFILLCVFAGMAGAVTDENKVLTKVGTQGNNVYISVEGGFSQTCLYNVAYIPATTNFGKFAFAALLTSKALNTPVSRIDYSVGQGGVCVITLVEIE
jgi:hypothetical protein